MTTRRNPLFETPRLHIVGRKNSGKTTLLSALTRELSQRGYTISTIKHTGHGHPIDTEGKDTWQHRRAGAVTTVMLMPNEFAVFADRPGEDQLLERIAPWVEDTDLVLVEGWSASHGACIEIRAQEDAEPVFTELPEHLLAFAADVPVPEDRPCFGRNDITLMADFIVQHVLGGKAPGQE
jgi:molybdopterin-guanine dinucleotide biosynthesis protein B